MFYPASPEALRGSVRDVLDEVGLDEGAAPKVLIVPHAGYVYSGSTAARGYATLRPVAGQVRRVVVIGPAHRVAVRGVAIPSVDRFETPLGPVDLDPPRRSFTEVPHVVLERPRTPPSTRSKSNCPSCRKSRRSRWCPSSSVTPRRTKSTRCWSVCGAVPRH
jgi:hypothetical protein